MFSFMLLSYQGDLKQFLRISKSKDDKVKSQPISTKTKVSVESCTLIDSSQHPAHHLPCNNKRNVCQLKHMNIIASCLIPCESLNSNIYNSNNNM